MALSTLRIIVFGEEWTGKSHVGNIILGNNTFDVKAGTQRNSFGTGEVHNKSVVVVDSPGWDSFCSEATPLRILADACHSLGQYGPDAEPHALLLTIPVSMDPEWNQRIAQRLERLFSPRIWRQTILLFTRPSCLNGRSIEYHLEHTGMAFQGLLERCGNRYHTLNTCTEDHTEVTLLLEKIEKMVEENCGECLNTKNLDLEMREQYDVRMEQLAMSCNQPIIQLEQILREKEELKLHIGFRKNEDFINMKMSEEESAFVEHEGGEEVEEQRYQEEDIMCVPEGAEYVGDKVPQQPALSLVATKWNSATEVQKVKGSGFGVTRPEPPIESIEITLFIYVDMEVPISVFLLTLVKRHHGSMLHWERIWTFAWWQMVVVNRYKEIAGIQRKAIFPEAAEPPRDYMVDGLKKQAPLASVKSCDSLPEITKEKKNRKEKGKERRPHKRHRSSSLQSDYNFVKDVEDDGKKGKRKGLKRSESCERIIMFGKPDHPTVLPRERTKVQDPVPRSRSRHQNCPPWIQPNSSCHHANYDN